MESRRSPLADDATSILASPYWSTIIGIANAEESLIYAPENNMGGLMSHGKLIPFLDLSAWITAEDKWLSTHEALHPTIESLNGYYVQPYNPNWQSTVISTKEKVENLKPAN